MVLSDVVSGLLPVMLYMNYIELGQRLLFNRAFSMVGWKTLKEEVEGRDGRLGISHFFLDPRSM